MTYSHSYWGRLLTTLFTLAVLPQLSAISIWINEIHYDNTGTDTGELVEIAGDASQNLSGYKLLLYNGNGGTLYRTKNLNGILPNESNGYGTLAFVFPANGIQNGTPDGIALVDPFSSIVQFLSYEGSFTAVGGAAAGLTSADIGVAESSSTPAAYSLQLTNFGSEYADFDWIAASAESPGSINAGQTFPSNDVSDAGASAMLLGIGFFGLLLLKRFRQGS